MTRRTLIDFFEDVASIPGEFLIYDDGYRTWSFRYDEVAAAARAFAARLAAAGIGRGHTVAIWAENRPEWIVAFWGCLLNATILVPIDYRASGAFLSRVADIVDARALLVGDVVDRATIDDGATGLEPDGAAARSASTRRPPHAAAPRHHRRRHRRNHLHVGRHRRSQGRRHHAPQHPGQHRADRARDGEVPPLHAAVPADPVPEPAAPQPHVRPGDGDLRAADAARPGRLHAQLRARRTSLRQIRTRRISVLVCVPKILEVLRDHVVRLFPETAAEPPAARCTGCGAGGTTAASIARSGSSSGPSSSARPRSIPALEAFWGRLGFVVVQGYGLTETAPIVTLNHPLRARRGAVGKPIAGVEVKIADGRRDPRAGRQRLARLLQRAGGDARGVPRRLVPHRRHRRARRAGSAPHPRPQEGDDRHAGRAERLSGGRRARAERAAGRA